MKQLTLSRENEFEFWCVVETKVNEKLKLVFETETFNMEMLYRMTIQLRRANSKNEISTLVRLNNFYGELYPKIRMNYTYVKSMYRRYTKIPAFHLLFNDHYIKSHERISQIYYIVPINELNLIHDESMIRKYDGLVFVDAWGPSLMRWFKLFQFDNMIKSNVMNINLSS